MIVGVKGASVFIRNLSAREPEGIAVIGHLDFSDQLSELETDVENEEKQFSCPEQLFLYYYSSKEVSRAGNPFISTNPITTQRYNNGKEASRY